jgi:hypothetical protein
MVFIKDEFNKTLALLRDSCIVWSGFILRYSSGGVARLIVQLTKKDKIKIIRTHPFLPLLLTIKQQNSIHPFKKM